MRHLGIDYGTRRIGLAVSDESGTLAFPLATIKAGSQALSEIHDIIKKENAGRIILGESRDFNNEANAVMEDITQFKKDLEEMTQLSVEYEAEVFSSALSSRQFEGNFGRKEKPSQDKLDASAAAVILQSYLDRQKNT